MAIQFSNDESKIVLRLLIEGKNAMEQNQAYFVHVVGIEENPLVRKAINDVRSAIDKIKSGL